MRIIRSATAFIGILLFLTACNTDQQRAGDLGPPSGTGVEAEAIWARDNLDLQRIGDLLERSDDPQEFEAYLNEDNGINNLDLNGDGYVDYISVEEFHDRGPYQRGFSVYDSFGPDQIQEVATIVFYRDDPSWSGARVLVTGNDIIYGENVYYETNWFDRPVNLISFVFGVHDPYRSPYYYDYYPPNYVAYDVVDTPVYITRVRQLYPQPVFVYTQRPDFVTKIKIKSPNNGKHFDRIFATLAKPTREQQKFIAENPRRPERAKAEKPGKPAPVPQPNDVAGREDRGGQPKHEPAGKPDGQGQPPTVRRVDVPKGNPANPGKSDPPTGKPDKQGGAGKGKKKG